MLKSSTRLEKFVREIETARIALGKEFEVHSFEFGEELETFLGSLNREQLIMQLEGFGLSEEATNFRLGKINESYVRSFLTTIYNRMRADNLLRARHERRRAKKKRK